MQFVVILALLFAIVVAVVAVQNTTPVTLRVLMLEVKEIAVSVLVLASMAVGGILTAIFGLGGWVRSVRAIRQRDETIARLEGELARERAGGQPPVIGSAADYAALPSSGAPGEEPGAAGGEASSPPSARTSG